MGPSVSPDQTSAPSADEEELARLRAEVALLRAQIPPERGDRRGWWRPVVVTLLVTMAALLAPLSVLATWANGQIQDTDRYVETIGPLASSPDVQDAIAARVEEVIFEYLDIDEAADELITAITARGISEPAAVTLQAAAGPLAAGIRNFVSGRILALVQSERFEQAWVEANRAAHSTLVAALTGEGDGAVDIEQGTVTVNLASVIDTLKQQLIEAGFGIADRIPEVDATFTIVESEDLAKVQNLLGLLDELSTWLPVIGLGMLGVAIVIARDRRQAVFAAGMAVAGSMLLLGATLNVIRPFYLDALPASTSSAAAGVVYDQLVSFIRFALRGVLVMAVTLAVAAWLSAPKGAGAAARAGLVRGIAAMRSGRTRAGLNTGRFGAALGQYRSAIRVGVLAVAAILYLSLAHPTGGTALGFVIVTAVVLTLLEVLASAPPAEATPAATPRRGEAQ
jgi:hypothetical protein